MLLAFLLALQDPAMLIEKLRADGVEERAAAYRELEALGETARPALEKALRDGNDEQRDAAKRLLQAAEVRKRMLGVRPRPLRVTLEARDETLPEAIQRFTQAFGLPPRALMMEDEKATQPRRVNLGFRDAGLWEAFDALASAIGEQLQPAEDGSLVSGPKEEAFWLKWDHPELRLWARLEPQRADDPGPRGVKLRVLAQLLPDAYPIEVSVEELVLRDPRGTSLALRPSERAVTFLRPQGRFAEYPLVNSPLVREPDPAAAPAQLAGTLVVVFPLDVERFQVPLPFDENPRIVPAGPAELLIDHVRSSPPTAFLAKYSFRTPPGAPRERFLHWVENETGRRYGDYVSVFDTDKQSRGGFGSRFSIAGARLIALRTIGETPLRVPFRIEGLRVPKKP